MKKVILAVLIFGMMPFVASAAVPNRMEALLRLTKELQRQVEGLKKQPGRQSPPPVLGREVSVSEKASLLIESPNPPQMSRAEIASVLHAMRTVLEAMSRGR